MASRCVCVCVCVCSVMLQKASSSFNSSKQTFLFSTRPCVVNKSFVVDFFQIIVNKAMDYSIANVCHRNFPAFIVTNNKFSVIAVTISTGIQILKKFIEIFFEKILKTMQFIRRFFAFPESKPTFPNIF